MAQSPHTRLALYRKRDKKKGPTRKVTFSVSDQTIQGLNDIRSKFHRRYPAAAFPTLSCVLEKVISKNLKHLHRPEILAAELADFERRYPKGTKPAPTTERNS